MSPVEIYKYIGDDMNLYVNLINKTIEYIEENISGHLTLSDISNQVHLSEFHFDRLFKVFVGKGLKQYVQGRKLTISLDRVKTSNDSIIDIAMDFGFEYPEVFGRAFKKQFGMSPKTYREKKPNVKIVEKASVIPRDFVNYRGGLSLKADYIHLEPLLLAGVSLDVDVYESGFESELNRTGEQFLTDTQNLVSLDQEKFYSVVNCHGDGSGIHTVFFGKESLVSPPPYQMNLRTVPGGWYAGFIYQGDMLKIRSTFVDDLFRWIAHKDIELRANGVGMISVYGKDYFIKQIVRILIPIKKPKS